MTGLGEDVYTAPDHFSDASKMVEAMLKAANASISDATRNNFREMLNKPVGSRNIIDPARAALESLGVDLSVLAALRSSEWVAVPKIATNEMLAAARQYDYAGMIVHDPDQDDWAAHILAAPKTPEDMR